MDSSQGTTTPHAAVRGPAPSPKNERKVTRLQTVDSPNGLFVYPSPFIFIFGLAGSPCYARAFSSCSEQGLLFVVVHELLIGAASTNGRTGSRACGLQ